MTPGNRDSHLLLFVPGPGVLGSPSLIPISCTGSLGGAGIRQTCLATSTGRLPPSQTPRELSVQGPEKSCREPLHFVSCRVSPGTLLPGLYPGSGEVFGCTDRQTALLDRSHLSLVRTLTNPTSQQQGNDSHPDGIFCSSYCVQQSHGHTGLPRLHGSRPGARASLSPATPA